MLHLKKMDVWKPELTSNGLNRLHIRTGIRCNNRCLFCIDGDREKDAKVDWISLKKQIDKELEDNRRFENVSFTTGEPTLNPFLPELVGKAKKLGYRSIAIVSNGRLFEDMAFCGEMLREGLSSVVVSIHGPNAAIHDLLTDTKGSFNETWRGILNLSELRKESSFFLATQTVLNKRNVNEIAEMTRLFLPLSVDAIVFTPMEPRGNGLTRFDELAAGYAEIADGFRAAELQFGRRALENRVKVEPAPFCVFRDMEYLIGKTNTVNVSDKDTGEIETFRAEERHVKGPKCGECVRAELCAGFWGLYAGRFGWEDATPYRT